MRQDKFRGTDFGKNVMSTTDKNNNFHNDAKIGTVKALNITIVYIYGIKNHLDLL